MKLNLAIAIWTAIIPLGYSVQVFSFIKDGSQYTCNIDSNIMPNADCLNQIAAACSPSSIVLSADCIRYNNKVLDYFPLGNPWRSFGDNCLPLRESSTGIKVTSTSSACQNSITNLKAKGYYWYWSNVGLELVPVTSELIDIILVNLGSGINIYGKIAPVVPAISWPSLSDAKYLSVGTVSPLSKRGLTFSISYSGYRFDCNKDENNNPYQDCLNTLKYFCSVEANICKSAVDYHVARFNINWQNYRNGCASWKNNNNLNQANTDVCKQASTNLLQTGQYIYIDQNTKQAIDLNFIDSLHVGLWNNQTILKSSSQDFISWLSTRGTIS